MYYSVHSLSPGLYQLLRRWRLTHGLWLGYSAVHLLRVPPSFPNTPFMHPIGPIQDIIRCPLHPNWDIRPVDTPVDTEICCHLARISPQIGTKDQDSPPDGAGLTMLWQPSLIVMGYWADVICTYILQMYRETKPLWEA